jgi:hypothetical protein
MIVFGWGGGRPKDLGPALPFQCSRCNREGFARYFTVTKWFRLYFIPIVPYQTKHFLVCPSCTAASELTTPAERQRAERLVALTTSLQSGFVSEEAYAERLKAELAGSAATSASLPSGQSVVPTRPDGVGDAARVAAIRSGESWSG